MIRITKEFKFEMITPFMVMMGFAEHSWSFIQDVLTIKGNVLKKTITQKMVWL